MPNATHAVEIDKPIGEVFAYVLDGTTAPTWRPGVLDIRLASGVSGQVGTRYEQGMKGPTGRIAADYELTEVVPNRLIAFKVTAGPARPEGRYEFALVGSATKVTFSLNWEPKGIKEKLMSPMVARTMPGEVATLDNLKRVLETS